MGQNGGIWGGRRGGRGRPPPSDPPKKGVVGPVGPKKKESKTRRSFGGGDESEGDSLGVLSCYSLGSKHSDEHGVFIAMFSLVPIAYTRRPVAFNHGI